MDTCKTDTNRLCSQKLDVSDSGPCPMASFGTSTVTIPQRNSLKRAQFGNGIINNKIHMQDSTYARHIHYVLFGELEYM